MSRMGIALPLAPWHATERTVRRLIRLPREAETRRCWLPPRAPNWIENKSKFAGGGPFQARQLCQRLGDREGDIVALELPKRQSTTRVAHRSPTESIRRKPGCLSTDIQSAHFANHRQQKYSLRQLRLDRMKVEAIAR